MSRPCFAAFVVHFWYSQNVLCRVFCVTYALEGLLTNHMLCHGVKFSYTALMEASGRGHAAVVQALIGAGADINLQNKASSALHELCYH
jgi:hypothetical protein